MTNTWLKNKAVTWVLVFVFLFTSVFSTGTAFAETADTQDNEIAAEQTVEESESVPVEGEEQNEEGEGEISAEPAIDSMTVYYYGDYNSIRADLDQMTEDGCLDIEIPSAYAGTHMTLDVSSAYDTQIYDIGSEEMLGSYHEFDIDDIEEGGSQTITFGVKNNDGTKSKVYTITIHATGVLKFPEVVSADFQENGMMLEKGNKVLHFVFTVKDIDDVNSAYMEVYLKDEETYHGVEATDVQPTDNENEYIATFELNSSFAGACAVTGLSVNGNGFNCYEEESDDYKFTFDVEPEYVEGIVINNISFADGFDGVVELTEDSLNETIELDFDVDVAEGYVPSCINLIFRNTDTEEDRQFNFYYDEETGTFENQIYISYDSFYDEGTYVLKKVAVNYGERVQYSLEDTVSFEYKNSIRDKEAPVFKDLYFTLDGVKCEEQGFNVTEDQELRVWADIEDAAGTDTKEVLVYFNTISEYGTGSVSPFNLYYDDESGLYSGRINVIGDAPEWYIEKVYAIDQFYNDEYYTTIDGKSVGEYWFLNGADAQPVELFYTVCFNAYGALYKEFEVATERKTSLNDMGIEIPEAPEAIGAEFLGWKALYDEGIPLIESNDQIISVTGSGFTLYPVYDKKIARACLYYYDTEGEYQEEYIFFGIDEGTTYGQFEDMITESGCLDNVEHDPSQNVVGWNYYSYHDDDDIITEDFSYIDCHAEYRDIQLVERTVYANGGTFADGSTEKDVEIDANEEGHMDKLEVPVREGYVFAGWTDGDGCELHHVFNGCDSRIIANWVSESDAIVKNAAVRYIPKGYDEEEYGYDTKRIWQEESTQHITLPYDTNQEKVSLYVQLLNGTEEIVPVEFTDGSATVTYDVVSLDGSNTVTHTVYIDIEEPPTEPYETYIKYYYGDGEEDYGCNYFEFHGNEGTAYVPYNFSSDKGITLRGFDLDGSWFETEGVVMGDADEVTISYTSKVNGETYTVTVEREEPNTNTGCQFDILVMNDGEESNYSLSTEDFDENGEGTLKLPYGSLSADSEVYVVPYPYSSRADVNIEYDEDYGWYRALMTQNEDGVFTKDVIVTAESGDARTYTINVKEAEGNVIKFNYIDANYTYMNESWSTEVDQYYAVSEEGDIVNIPYLYDREEGIRISYYSGNGSYITGLEEKYDIDENGLCEITFTGHSPDGTVSQEYKATLKLGAAPAEPFDVYARYCNTEGHYHSEAIDPEDGEFYVTSDYDQEYGIDIYGYDTDGVRFEGKINTAEGETEYVLNSANGKQYTFTYTVLPVNRDTSCMLKLRAYTGNDSKYITIDPYEALSEEGAVVTVPYGSITDIYGYGENSVRLDAYPGSSSTKLDVTYDYEMDEYRELLTPNEDGKIEKTVTATAKSGDKAEYKLTIVEASPAEMAIGYMEVNWRLGDSYEGTEINAEDLLKNGEVTVEVPYYYDVERGIEVYCEPESGTKVSGLEDKFTIDETGKTTVTFKVTAPNGLVSQDCKIHLVKGEKPESLQYARVRYVIDPDDEEEGTEGVTVNFDENNYAEVYIPYSYDRNSDVTFVAEDVDGTYIRENVEINDGEGVVNYTSDVNGKTYTVKVIVSEMSGDTGCDMDVWASNGTDGTGFFVDMNAAMSEKGATVVVPYGTITDADNRDDNEILVYLYPVRGATLTGTEQNGRYAALTPDGEGGYTAEVTVTAEDGKTSQTYKLHIIEDNGDAIDVTEFELGFREKFTEYEDIYKWIDAEEVKGDEGATITVPFSANEHNGIYIGEYGSFGKVKGANKRYYLDENGEATVKITAYSPNGKNSQVYTFHLVKDAVGDSAEPDSIRLSHDGIWGELDSECFAQIDLKEAATEEGTTVAAPAVVFEKENLYANLQVETYLPIDIETSVTYSDGSVTYDEGYRGNVYHTIHAYGQDSAVILVKTTSENHKVSKTYKINLVKEEAECTHPAADREVIPAVPATCTATGLTAGEKCGKCGEILVEQKVDPAKGHKHNAVVTKPTCTSGGYTTYTCVCGDSYVDDRVNATGHTYGNWITDKAAGCETAGSKHRTCACGATETASIAATGHLNKETLPAVESTCTATGLTAGEKCKDCGKILTEQQIEPMKDHSYGAYVTTKKAGFGKTGRQERTCINCPAVDPEYKTIAAVKTPKLSATSYTFNNKTKKPTVKITGLSSQNYTVTYAKGRKSVGKYSVKITLKGNYSGSKTLYFKINPAKPTSIKLTKGKKQIKVSWKKPSKTYRNQIDGYQIRYAVSKSKLAKAKPVKVSSKTAVSKTIKSLKSKKTYYVQVRTYNKVGSTTYYSGWTTAKSTKTK